MTESPFNLITEPWIRVRDGEGVRDVSLRECFAEAHVIRALAGEVATQDAAILRLLLAILHRSVADLPRALERAGNRIAFGLLSGGLIIGSSLLVASPPPLAHIGIIGLVAAGLLGFALVLAALWSKKD